MNIREINYFVELGKEKNFTRAANKLNISQPALSKAIKLLEDDIGITLIDRTSKKFKLTTEGENFYNESQKSLGIINIELNKLYSNVKNRKKVLNVGIPPVIGLVYFTSIIAKFKRENPQVYLRILEEGSNNVKKKVLDEELELGIIIFPFESENFVSIPIVDGEVVLVVNKDHRLAERKSVNMRELKDERFVTLNENFMMYNKIINACAACGFKPDIATKSCQAHFVIEMVALNEGISIMPRPIVERYLTDNIRMIDLDETFMDWNIGSIYKKNKYLSKEANDFMNCVISELRNKK